MSKVKIKCYFCKKYFYRYKSQIKNKNFCSKKCIKDWYKSRNREINCLYCNKKFNRWESRICKYENNFCSKKCRDNWQKGKYFSKGVFKRGEEHLNWKGNEVKYSGLHKWVREHKQKPERCKKCKMVNSKLDLANISGEYKRDIKDYEYLCRGCHIEKDKLNKKVVEDEIVKIEKVKCNKKMWDIETESKNFIANGIVTHNCRRSKKSISIGFYMPDTTKERIKVGVAIDTSGSIGDKELTDFLSEIIGMARGYKGQMDMKLYCHDVDVQAEYDVQNGDIEKIKKISMKGGGGTSHIPVMKHINENLKDCKAVIFFTDGFSDIQDVKFSKNKFQSIFVITKDGSDEQLKGKPAHVIKLR